MLAGVAALAATLSMPTVAAASPTKPSRVHLSDVTQHTATLAWRDNSSGETRFVTRYRVAGAGDFIQVTRPRNSTSWTRTGLTEATAYEFGVRACGSGGCSSWSGTKSVSTLASDLGLCSVFPPNDSFNRDISGDDVDSNSDNYIEQILDDGGNDFHPDFGSNPDYGIPYVIVPGSEPKVPIHFRSSGYGDESDPGPYPVPPGAPIEGGSDDHVLVVDRNACVLYELYRAAFKGPDSHSSGWHWHADSGAVFDLGDPLLGQRPDGWTSADAAGLPIFPGLARHDEASTSTIDHALRITFAQTQRAYLDPATHYASSSCNVDRPPMGLRLRLGSAIDPNDFTGQARAVVEAMQTYGVIVADNGSNFFVSGQTSPSWDDDELNQLKDISGDAFEVVDVPGTTLHLASDC